MELLIRSQDKLKLITNPKLKIEWDIYGRSRIEDMDTKKIMGEYETKQRALEVLDEIQKFIEEFQTITAELDEYGNVVNEEHHKKVYEMPKE